MSKYLIILSILPFMLGINVNASNLSNTVEKRLDSLENDVKQINEHIQDLQNNYKNIANIQQQQSTQLSNIESTQHQQFNELYQRQEQQSSQLNNIENNQKQQSQQLDNMQKEQMNLQNAVNYTSGQVNYPIQKEINITEQNAAAATQIFVKELSNIPSKAAKLQYIQEHGLENVPGLVDAINNGQEIDIAQVQSGITQQLSNPGKREEILNKYGLHTNSETPGNTPGVPYPPQESTTNINQNMEPGLPINSNSDGNYIAGVTPDPNQTPDMVDKPGYTSEPTQGYSNSGQVYNPQGDGSNYIDKGNVYINQDSDIPASPPAQINNEILNGLDNINDEKSLFDAAKQSQELQNVINEYKTTYPDKSLDIDYIKNEFANRFINNQNGDDEYPDMKHSQLNISTSTNSDSQLNISNSTNPDYDRDIRAQILNDKPELANQMTQDEQQHFIDTGMVPEGKQQLKQALDNLQNTYNEQANIDTKYNSIIEELQNTPVEQRQEILDRYQKNGMLPPMTPDQINNYINTGKLPNNNQFYEQLQNNIAQNIINKNPLDNNNTVQGEVNNIYKQLKSAQNQDERKQLLQSNAQLLSFMTPEEQQDYIENGNISNDLYNNIAKKYNIDNTPQYNAPGLDGNITQNINNNVTPGNESDNIQNLKDNLTPENLSKSMNDPNSNQLSSLDISSSIRTNIAPNSSHEKLYQRLLETQKALEESNYKLQVCEGNCQILKSQIANQNIPSNINSDETSNIPATFNNQPSNITPSKQTIVPPIINTSLDNINPDIQTNIGTPLSNIDTNVGISNANVPSNINNQLSSIGQNTEVQNNNIQSGNVVPNIGVQGNNINQFPVSKSLTVRPSNNQNIDKNFNKLNTGIIQNAINTTNDDDENLKDMVKVMNESFEKQDKLDSNIQSDSIKQGMLQNEMNTVGENYYYGEEKDSTGEEINTVGSPELSEIKPNLKLNANDYKKALAKDVINNMAPNIQNINPNQQEVLQQPIINQQSNIGSPQSNVPQQQIYNNENTIPSKVTNTNPQVNINEQIQTQNIIQEIPGQEQIMQNPNIDVKQVNPNEQIPAHDINVLRQPEPVVTQQNNVSTSSQDIQVKPEANQNIIVNNDNNPIVTDTQLQDNLPNENIGNQQQQFIIPGSQQEIITQNEEYNENNNEEQGNISKLNESEVELEIGTDQNPNESFMDENNAGKEEGDEENIEANQSVYSETIEAGMEQEHTAEEQYNEQAQKNIGSGYETGNGEKQDVNQGGEGFNVEAQGQNDMNMAVSDSKVNMDEHHKYAHENNMQNKIGEIEDSINEKHGNESSTGAQGEFEINSNESQGKEQGGEYQEKEDNSSYEDKEEENLNNNNGIETTNVEENGVLEQGYEPSANVLYEHPGKNEQGNGTVKLDEYDKTNYNIDDNSNVQNKHWNLKNNYSIDNQNYNILDVDYDEQENQMNMFEHDGEMYYPNGFGQDTDLHGYQNLNIFGQNLNTFTDNLGYDMYDAEGDFNPVNVVNNGSKTISDNVYGNMPLLSNMSNLDLAKLLKLTKSDGNTEKKMMNNDTSMLEMLNTINKTGKNN